MIIINGLTDLKLVQILRRNFRTVLNQGEQQSQYRNFLLLSSGIVLAFDAVLSGVEIKKYN